MLITKRRYHAFKDYLFKRYQQRIQKISLDAGFGCPHRTGESQRQGTGCIYCENSAFSPHSKPNPLPLEKQLALGIKYSRKRYHANRFFAYFQAYTNTYAPLETLEKHYSVIRQFPEVVGLAVGTRPDCVDQEILSLLGSYANDYEVWLELGLQSSHNATLDLIQRGHTVESFFHAIEQAANKPLRICVHLILGLPGENHVRMMETAKFLADLPIHGVKIHHCQVIRGTSLAKIFREGGYEPLTFPQYLSYVCDFLEYLPWPITIQRLFGESPKEMILAPQWGFEKTKILQAIDTELEKRDSYQGSRFHGLPRSRNQFGGQPV